MRSLIWSIKDLVYVIKKRQANEFDANFAVSGNRGDGKSHLINKVFYRMGKFDPWKHQVYSQEDVKRLLMTQIKGKIFDDEAINSGYKRNFQNKGQQELIKILTNYRDSFNVHGSAIPNFFSLDKDLRDLIFLHIHIIERGLAVIHLPLQSRLYSQDKWDSKNNAKIEESWNDKIKNKVNFKIPFHKLSTFAGYLYYSDITDKQAKLYKEIKRVKRAKEYEDNIEDAEQSLHEKVYNMLINKQLTDEGLLQICLNEGKKYSLVRTALNRMLKDRGEKLTYKDYLNRQTNKNHNNHVDRIKDLVPAFPQ